MSRSKSDPSKPAPVKVGRVRGYAIRPPRPGDPHRAWYWQIMGPGRKTLWTGWATRTEAESRAAAALLALPAEGTLPAAPALPASKVTVADVLVAWLDDLASRHYVRPASRRGAKQRAEQLNRLMGGMEIGSVTVATTGAYLQRRIGEGVKDRTAYGELCILRTAWRWGHKARLHEGGDAFPMPPIRLSPLVTTRPATREDAWTVLDALGEVCAPDWAVRCYSLGLVTGARTGELWALTVGDFDAAAGTLSIKGGKTGERTVYLGDHGTGLVSEMTAGRDAGERIVGDVAWFTVQTRMGKWIGRACKHVGIEPFSCYGLRRSAVDTYYAAGCDLGGAASQLGHTPEVAQRHYRRVNASVAQKEAARAALGQRPGSEEQADGDSDGQGNVLPFRRAGS